MMSTSQISRLYYSLVKLNTVNKTANEVFYHEIVVLAMIYSLDFSTLYAPKFPWLLDVISSTY